MRFVVKRYILQQKSERTNRTLSARNTLVQLLAVYTNPESHNAQRHRQTDGQTDGQQDDANSRSYCVAIRSAKMAKSRLILETEPIGVFGVRQFNATVKFTSDRSLLPR